MQNRQASTVAVEKSVRGAFGVLSVGARSLRHENAVVSSFFAAVEHSSV